MKILGHNSGLSKAKGDFPETPGPWALQTRAAVLPSPYLADPEALRELCDILVARGFNTLLVPTLQDGDLYFRTRSSGSLSRRSCPSREALRLLAHYPVSVWLYVDPLTAGTPGTPHLGSFARQHRDWLVKNSAGSHEVGPEGEIPGLFCWTTLQFRRFLGNLLVDIVDSYPVDGVLFDVRNFPVTTHDPATWTHLSYSCLRRVRRELMINIEDFLTEPTLEQFNDVEEWRRAEFGHLIETLKARMQKARFQIVVGFLADFSDGAQPPWHQVLVDGVVDELALMESFAQDSQAVAALDAMASDERPFLAAMDNEQDLAAQMEAAARSSATGVLVMTPDLEATEALPPSTLVWDRQGAVESNPAIAAIDILTNIKHNLDPADPVSLFFMELEEFLTTDVETLRFDELMKVRDNLMLIKKQLVEEDAGGGTSRPELIRELDLVIRLLFLAPAPPLEY